MELSDYYITVPPRSSLCCTICTVDPDEVRDSSAKSYFHWKTLKCRYILNLMPSTVIASPIHRSRGHFYVITTRSFYQTGILHKNLMRINLTHSVPQVVTPAAYVDCLAYTFEFYMSPTWNKVSNIYLEGSSFLSNSEFNTAVTSAITLTSRESAGQDEIRVRLTALAARLPPMKLENLAIPSIAVAPFLEDPEGILDVSMFVMQRVIVIPSMKKAVLRRVMKKIPATCAFQDYSEIRRHWKNMYGYRLPKTDEGILYYEVYFPIPSRTIEYFIYPDICIRREMSQRPVGDPDHLKGKFLRDLVASMPTVLDEPLQVFLSSQANNPPAQFAEKTCQLDASGFTTPLPVGVSQNPADSARLSLTGGPLKRDASTQMSPTPSLGGKWPGNDKRKLQFDNLKKIHQIHKVAPSTSEKTPRGGRKLQKPVKVFLNESEMSKYFQNSSGVSQKKNIFRPYERKLENLEVPGGDRPPGPPGGEERASKVKIVGVTSGTYPCFN